MAVSSSEIANELTPRLSPTTKISFPTSVSEFEKVFGNWSSYNLKVPQVLVQPKTENDVLEVFRYATKKNIPIAIKAGGLSNKNSVTGGLAIDLSEFKGITVNTPKSTVTLQSGVLGRDLIDACFQEGFCVGAGAVGKLGMTGFILGGGFSMLQGLHGLGIDNLVSLRLITAAGEIVTCSESENQDLFWGVRGAGKHFGLVLEYELRIYPLEILEGTKKGEVFVARILFSPDQMEEVAKAIIQMKSTERMVCGLNFACPPPAFEPMITLDAGYFGSSSDGESAYSLITALGPKVMQAMTIPLVVMNKGGDIFTQPGGYKSHYGWGVNKMEPLTLTRILKLYMKFVADYPDAKQSTVMFERFPMNKVNSIPGDATAFAHRNVKSWGFVQLWYLDPATEAAAMKFGETVRGMMRDADDSQVIKSYAEYSHGDETPEQIFGENVQRLTELKEKWDPDCVFPKLEDF